MAGASGYVLKEVRGAALVDAIHAGSRVKSLLQADDVEHVLAPAVRGPGDRGVAG